MIPLSPYKIRRTSFPLAFLYAGRTTFSLGPSSKKRKDVRSIFQDDTDHPPPFPSTSDEFHPDPGRRKCTTPKAEMIRKWRRVGESYVVFEIQRRRSHTRTRKNFVQGPAAWSWNRNRKSWLNKGSLFNLKS